MSYENRKREYERLKALGKESLIPLNLQEEFGEKLEPISPKITKKKGNKKK